MKRGRVTTRMRMRTPGTGTGMGMGMGETKAMGQGQVRVHRGLIGMSVWGWSSLGSRVEGWWVTEGWSAREKEG